MKLGAELRQRVLAADRHRAPRPIAWLCSLALLLVATGCALSALVGIGEPVRPVLGFAAVAVAAGTVGALLLRSARPPARIPPPDAVLAVVAAWGVSVLASTAAYLVTGGIDGADDALFESSSGYATSALTVVPDPSTLPDSVRRCP